MEKKKKEGKDEELKWYLKMGVFLCSHLIRELIVKLYHSFSNILYSPQVSLIQGSLIP